MLQLTSHPDIYTTDKHTNMVDRRSNTKKDLDSSDDEEDEDDYDNIDIIGMIDAPVIPEDQQDTDQE